MWDERGDVGDSFFGPRLKTEVATYCTINFSYRMTYAREYFVQIAVSTVHALLLNAIDFIGV